MTKLCDIEDMFIFQELLKEEGFTTNVQDLIKKINTKLKDKLTISHNQDYYYKRIEWLIREGYLEAINSKPKGVKIKDTEENKEIVRLYITFTKKMLRSKAKTSFKKMDRFNNES